MINYMTQARDLPKIAVAAYHLIPYSIFDAQEGEVDEYCCILSVDLIHTHLPVLMDILFWIQRRLKKYVICGI
jgi:hypothetical protein